MTKLKHILRKMLIDLYSKFPDTHKEQVLSILTSEGKKHDASIL